MSDFNEKLNSFRERVSNVPPKIIVQEVKPTLKTKVNETQINAWLENNLLKKLKQKGLDTNKSLKIMLHEAIELYIK